MVFEISQEFIDKLELAATNRDHKYITEALGPLHEADLSVALWPLRPIESRYVLDQLPLEKVAKVIAKLDKSTQKNFISNSYFPKELSSILDVLDSDEVTAILREQPHVYTEIALANMCNGVLAENVRELLRYRPDCAGGWMAKEFFALDANATVADAMHLFGNKYLSREKSNVLFVTDATGTLIGTIDFFKLARENHNTPLGTIANTEIYTVNLYADILETSLAMQRYEIATLPITNMQGRLLGIITIDDAQRAIKIYADTDAQTLFGITDEVNHFSPISKLINSRVIWTIISVAAALSVSQFVGLFDPEIKNVPSVAWYLPLIVGLVTRSAFQASGLTLQFIEPIRLGKVGNYLKNATIAALILAVIASTIVALFVLLTSSFVNLAWVLAVALFVSLAITSTISVYFPLLFDKIGLNPNLASGQLLFLTTDLVSIATYLSIIRLFYRFLV